MKKLIFLTFLFSLSNYANTDITVTANCNYELKNKGINGSGRFEDFTLSTQGKNSNYLEIILSKDSNNGILVSLNHTANICSLANCDTYSGKVYTLLMVRVENNTKQALQLDKPQNAKGRTSSTIQISKYENTRLETEKVDDNNELIYAKNEPDSYNKFIVENQSLDYTVSGQKTEINCKFDIR
jgi:hypothetical protein